MFRVKLHCTRLRNRKKCNDRGINEANTDPAVSDALLSNFPDIMELKSQVQSPFLALQRRHKVLIQPVITQPVVEVQSFFAYTLAVVCTEGSKRGYCPPHGSIVENNVLKYPLGGQICTKVPSWEQKTKQNCPPGE